MRAPDFSRQDVAFATALAILAGFVFGAWASLTFIQGAVSGAAWTGIVGTLVGGAIGFFGTTYHDRRRREREVADLKASLYAEIADRKRAMRQRLSQSMAYYSGQRSFRRARRKISSV